ncbi:leucine-rich repeat-containing protein (LRR) [Tieghemostelium lacteum]|uniref:protein-tyrosine-phosphatase n=1 Tax=Tieghemostelium lacteum TaxID=361077 RepID=A0A151ZS99_TIELA|nr:leucine-rich repeat-containing protein (LRR) [Tieghemostelium lacteum]|eukprot:KYQ96800.1 leucine-rich repeat-containing protein (LRR) [Tieghemostelium lacteum]
MIKKIFSGFGSSKKQQTMGSSNSKGSTISQKITPIYQNNDHILFVEYEPGSPVYACCYAELTEIPQHIFTSKNPKQDGITTTPTTTTTTTTTTTEETTIENSTESTKVTTPTTGEDKLEENPHLVTLILDFNKIKEIPESIGLLVNLKELSLASNQLTEIPDYLTKLQFLTTLQIGLNPLTSFPTVVCNIKSLTTLHLESNQITELPDSFENLVNLKTLSLMDNNLKSIPKSLPTQIEKLNLSCNEIENVQSESLERLGESLVTLTLLENRIKEFGSSFGKLSKLQTLILDCNYISEIPGNVVLGMKSLITFNVPHNQLTTLPAELIKLPIKVMDVRGNPFEIIKTKSMEQSSTSLFQLEDFILDKEHLTSLQVEQLDIIISNIPDQENEESQKSASTSTKNNGDNQRMIFWQSIIPDLIIDKLYLGCRECAMNKNWLLQNNITHILTVAQLNPLYSDLFKYKCIKIDDVDSEDIYKYFKEIVEFIEEGRTSGGGVLVHCRAGVSRSATSIIAYLMTKNNITYQEAFNLTVSKRNRICPNLGFRAQLKKYEETLFKK